MGRDQGSSKNDPQTARRSVEPSEPPRLKASAEAVLVIQTTIHQTVKKTKCNQKPENTRS